MHRWTQALGTLIVLLGVLPATAQTTPAAKPTAGLTAANRAPRQLMFENKPWRGDFDAMLERRLIRIVAPFSRSLYFFDKGQERGISAEFVRDFERWLNRKYAKQLGRRPVTVALFPATRDRLLGEVADGLAEIAVGGLTVTEERQKLVDMIAPGGGFPVRELLLTGPKSPAIATLDDLSGKTVHVRGTSSYHESLVALNGRFRSEGKPEVKLVLVPDALEDEDLMEMLSTGLVPAIVVDDWIAKIWAPVLPKVTVHDDVVLREGGALGWAIRKNSPKLAAELADFYLGWAKQQGVVEHRLREYAKRVKLIKDPTKDAEWQRFMIKVQLFEKYGGQYRFDPLMLIAQGFQESQLDQNRRSKAGAVGVMQITPKTAKDLNTGDIHQLESNIHAGAKYMDQLMTRYFSDAAFDEQNRTLFGFASYNAGPGNIARAREEAAQRKLDPNRWFNNVEVVVAETVGAETTTYVRNIFKYYVTYKLVLEAQQQSVAARQPSASGN
jgi:membrane-bound lytic murein transglycosylase MltF